MRDPDLVQRAERAAMALERAWGHWRVMHGLGADPLPPVSSYVGYSLEEPWGQPRVVFGVGAEEAERLAALLAGHDCVGPVHAEVIARPDWRLAASSGPATAQGRQFDGEVSVPVQAPPPGAEPAAELDAWHGTATADAEETNGRSAGIGWQQAAPTAMDSAMPASYRAGPDEHEPPGSSAPMRAESASELPTSAALGPATLEPLPADPHEPPWLSPVQHVGDRGQGEPDSGTPYADEYRAAGRAGSLQPPAAFWQHGEPAGTVELAAIEQASVIAFRRRPEQPSGQWQEQTPEPPASDSHDAAPSQGPGYCGPRYQGFPPQYQPGPGQPDPPALFGVGPEDGGEPTAGYQPGLAQSGSDQPEVAQSGRDQPEAAQSGMDQPEVGQSDRDQPEVAQSGAEQPAASGPSADRAKTAQSPAAQSPAAQSAVRQSKTASSRTGPSSTGPSSTGPSGTVQSGGQAKAGQARAVQSKSGQQPKTVQPKTVQSKTVQSKSGPSRTGQSKGGQQPRTVQPKTVPSKADQARQTSQAGSPGRASGSDAGKRPRG